MKHGLTFYVCVGKYAGFHIRTEACFLITLGVISFGFVYYDIEVASRALMERIQELEANQITH